MSHKKMATVAPKLFKKDVETLEKSHFVKKLSRLSSFCSRHLSWVRKISQSTVKSPHIAMVLISGGTLGRHFFGPKIWGHFFGTSQKHQISSVRHLKKNLLCQKNVFVCSKTEKICFGDILDNFGQFCHAVVGLASRRCIFSGDFFYQIWGVPDINPMIKLDCSARKKKIKGELVYVSYFE